LPLADLQRVLDESLGSASSLTRGLFSQNAWDAQAVEDYLNEKGTISIATIGRDGEPHAALVVAGCQDGVIFFTASKGSAMLGNLRRQSALAFTVGEKIVGKGEALLAGHLGDLDPFASGVSRALRDLQSEGWDGYMYRIRLSRLFAA
jgi:hypothetical protein